MNEELIEKLRMQKLLIKRTIKKKFTENLESNCYSCRKLLCGNSNTHKNIKCPTILP